MLGEVEVFGPSDQLWTVAMMQPRRSSACFVSRTFATATAGSRCVLIFGIPLFWLKLRVKEVSCVEVGTAIC